MTIRSFTVDQLVVSPLNVRTNREDAEATEALEASIAAHGLIEPLIVHPLEGDGEDGGGADGTGAAWAVLAGGRRFRALANLVETGRLPRDHPIECTVRDLAPAQITELSLAENLLRRPLRPYEVHAAITVARAQGATAEEIAERFGQRLVWVRQQLRLGNLAPELFAAYAEGRLELEHAQAYAATEDHELQRAAYAHFAAQPQYHNAPHLIRAWLKVGDREEARLLRFVGEDVYRAAGGGFELDLFADEAGQRGRVVDPALLRAQVENKLADLRQRLRKRTGRSDLRFAAEPPQRHGYDDASLLLAPEKRGPKIVLPGNAEIVATVAIGEDGEATPQFWWASRAAKAASAKEGAAVSTPLPAGHPERIADASGFDTASNPWAAQAARAAVRDEHGLSADGLQVVRSLRRELLRALLVEDAVDAGGTLGRDYVIWAQLRQLLGDARERPADVGARGLAGSYESGSDSAPADVVKPLLDETGAHAVFRQAVATIDAHPSLTLDDPADGLAAFVAETEEWKALAGAVLAGFALLRSANVGGWRIAAHDRLAALAGAAAPEALRRHWCPTPAFLGLFSKSKRIELADPSAGFSNGPQLSRLKDADLSAATARLLAADPAWVHPLLSFPGSSGTASEAEAGTAIPAAAIPEAAE